MEYMLKTLCKELDVDILDLLMKESDVKGYGGYKNWQLLADPFKTALDWQMLREVRKNKP